MIKILLSNWVIPCLHPGRTKINEAIFVWRSKYLLWRGRGLHLPSFSMASSFCQVCGSNIHYAAVSLAAGGDAWSAGCLGNGGSYCGYTQLFNIKQSTVISLLFIFYATSQQCATYTLMQQEHSSTTIRYDDFHTSSNTGEALMGERKSWSSED